YNVQHAAPLFFVSPQQVNYLIPDQAAPGAGRIMVNNGAGVVSQGTLQIANSSLGIFTVNSSGTGVAAAVTTSDGVTFFSTVNPDGSPRAALNSTPWRPNFLILFGTGFSRVTDLRVSFGGVETTPTFVGPQGSLAGLTQVNVRIPDTPPGLINIMVTAEGRVSNTVQLLVQPLAFPPADTLSVADVQLIIAQAVAKAQQLGVQATIAVIDEEANVLGIFKMNGAGSDILIGSTAIPTGRRAKQTPPIDPDGLEGIPLPLPGSPPGLLSDGAALAAISKAGTAAFFSTQGSSITTRTASFIVQENFPPLVINQMGGPLFGVQFSSLPCSDVKIRNLPLGLSGDPGGVPIYKNGTAVGAVGIEGDGFYSVDIDPSDMDQSKEEIIGLAATLGFEPSPDIRIDTMQIDGKTLPYLNAQQSGGPAPPSASLSGAILPPIRPQQTSRFSPLTLGGVPGRVDSRFFPFKGSAVSSLTVDDVTRIITQAAQQAYRTRAAIRRPIGVPAEVNITVVDTSGTELGIFTTIDGPIVGFHVNPRK